DKVVEPDVLVNERLKRGAELPGRASLKVVPGAGEQAILEADDRTEINAVGGKCPSMDVAGVDQAVFPHQVRTDESRIAGKCGETLIGRIAVARRSQRQN